MSEVVTQLRERIKELEEELRWARLRTAACEKVLEDTQAEALRVVGCARRSIDKAVQDEKFRCETWLIRVVSSRQATARLEEFLGDPQTDIGTLEDLRVRPRSEIASIKGVGRKTMAQLDAALAERGWCWADETGERPARASLCLVEQPVAAAA